VIEVWVLVLNISYGSPQILQVPGFVSNLECQDAGKKIKESFYAPHWVKYTCVSQGGIK